MPFGEKLGRPFELLSLLSRKPRKDESIIEPPQRLTNASARAYANATGSDTSGFTPSTTYSHTQRYGITTPTTTLNTSNNLKSHHHTSTSSSTSNTSSFYPPRVKYERLSRAPLPTPVVQYERLTVDSAPARVPPPGSGTTHPSPLDYEAVARKAAFPSPDLIPSDAVASSSFRAAPSAVLASLPSPGMLTPLPPGVGATGATQDSIRVRPPRATLASPAPIPVIGSATSASAASTFAPFSSVMEEWMSQLSTPTPDVTLLPSPYDFNKDTPTPMDTNSMDLRRLQDALLPTPPPDIHDHRQHPKTSAYVTTRGPRPLLEDIASLCRDLNSQDVFGAAGVTKSILSSSSGQMEVKYTSVSARPLRAREESVGSAYSDEGSEGQVRMLAAAAALSSVSSMDVDGTPTSGSYCAGAKSKRRKVCTAEGCQNLSRSRGLCKAHGGGRRCSVEGCSRASQSGSLCITHGGGKRCTVQGCQKAAQSRGMCKAHGGGVRCRVEGCSKSSQGDGFCRSHGGGRRCGHPSGCSKAGTGTATVGVNIGWKGASRGSSSRREGRSSRTFSRVSIRLERLLAATIRFLSSNRID
uniref:WRKY19-like zinc finger domain-containing protein n=1 Tax=Hyaloperonospora arabidopsidis (strain Emoy2) TaxID=559515 RepID=M4C5S6_HYAAE